MSPTGVTGPKPRPVIARWAEKVDVPEEAVTPLLVTLSCWPWTGSKTQGYGILHVGSHTDGSRRIVRAHRIAYEAFIGPVPDGLDLDHLCHNDSGCPGGASCPHRACVNPWHLEAVTRQDNLLRGETVPAANAAKTHCPYGHAYDEENTYFPARGGRSCRTCNRNWRRMERRRRATASPAA